MLLTNKNVGFLLEHIDSIYLISFWLQFLELLLPFLILYYAVFCCASAQIQDEMNSAKKL